MTKTPTYLVRFYRDGKLLHAQRDTLIEDVLKLCRSSGAIAEIVPSTEHPECRHIAWSAQDVTTCPQAPDGIHRYTSDYFCTCGELEPSTRLRCNKIVGLRGKSMRDYSGGRLCDGEPGHGSECWSSLLRRAT